MDAEPLPGRRIALLYSSNVHGEIERCGCPDHPLGGLARRAAEVERIRAESDGVISVDAGDLFLPPGKPPKDAERRARLIATIYGRLGVTAFSPGETDLALGAETLRRVLAEAKVPAVSANLFDLKGRPLFDADRIVDLAGVKVGIFGVTAASPADARLRGWGVEARDPAAAARAAVGSLRARGARIVVALVHVGGVSESKELVRDVPGIDWAVLGHSGMNLELPMEAGGARLLEAMAGGKNLGRLDLHVVDEGRRAFADRGARAQLKAILEDHERQLADYEARVRGADAGVDYERKRVVELKRAIATESTTLAALPERVAGNWFENRVVELDTVVPDRADVTALVDAYKRKRRPSP